MTRLTDSTELINLFIERRGVSISTQSSAAVTVALRRRPEIRLISPKNCPGATGGWHTLSHHGGKADALAKLARIEEDLLKHLDAFLADLDAIKDGDATLLDHTTVVIGSNFGDSSNHTCNNLPTIVAGGGHRHQAHTVLEKPTHLCDLYLELLHKHNIDAPTFGNSQHDRHLLG